MRPDLQRLKRDTSIPNVVRAPSPARETVEATSTRGRGARATTLITIALLVVAAAFYFTRKTNAPLPSRKTSLVVLPFTSADKDQEYFSDGLAEELIGTLSRNPKLRVISRSSAFSFKGKETDIKTIAQKLNVTHVLEGSVRKSGNQTRPSSGSSVPTSSATAALAVLVPNLCLQRATNTTKIPQTKTTWYKQKTKEIIRSQPGRNPWVSL